MKAVGNYIIIKQVTEEVTTESGLLMSGEEANRMRYKMGDVKSVGHDVKTVGEGDRIYYDVRQSHTMLIVGVAYTVIRESDVVVVV